MRKNQVDGQQVIDLPTDWIVPLESQCNRNFFRKKKAPKGDQWIKNFGRSVSLSLCEFVSGEESDSSVKR